MRSVLRLASRYGVVIREVMGCVGSNSIDDVLILGL